MYTLTHRSGVMQGAAPAAAVSRSSAAITADTRGKPKVKGAGADLLIQSATHGWSHADSNR